MTGYNGIVQIEVNHLANRTEVNRIKQEVAELTQTFAAFMGSSGHSVKIWLRFTRPDKSLPKDREEAEIFQAHAYRKAVSLYQPALSYSIELKNPTLEQFCRQTCDPELTIILTPPSFICVSHWKCHRTQPTKNPYRQKHLLSND